MKVSDLFVRCLENENITHIFGVPGEENADFMMSLEDSSIEFVLCRHEQAAAFMAEAYGRLTGNPAGCLATLGPGATNLITGVADANMDRAPMLVLTGQGAVTRQHKESHQIMDVVEMYQPVTKWAHAIGHPDNIPEVVRKAVRLARTEKPGAVLIELAEDIAKMDAAGQPMTVRRFRRPGPDDKIVNRAFELLCNAKRPIILAGNGAVRKRAARQLRLLCDATGIGVISTFMAKGCVDMDDPACMFTIGLQARDHVACLIEEADLVVTLGYDMVEYHPRLWNPNGDKTIVHADFLPAEIDANYNPQVELVGDVAHTLWMLNERIASHGTLEVDLTRQIDTRQAMIAEFEQHADDATEGVIRPQKALWDLRQVMGSHDILLSDVGAHKMWIARHFHCHEPNTCLIPNGFCSMGFALPGAIGTSIVVRNGLDGGSSDRRVVAIAGDAGFLMNVQDMETATRINADLTVFVWEDHEYGLIAWKQETEFGKHTDLAFGNPDWLKLGEAFGWRTSYVDRSADLAGTLEEAIAHNGPALVVMPVDYRENRKLTERLGNIACAI